MRNRSVHTLLLFASLILPVATALSQDSTPPTVSSQIPAAGAAVVQLGQIEVFFSEDVQGVDAGDLLIGGVAATNVFQVVPSQYRFRFAPPANGTVQITWIAGSGITDLANPANAFAGGSWTYTLDPALAFNSVRINEFMAANETGIRDEDGDREDWIEIYNGSPIAVELGNCFLTDDRSQLDGWRFPSFAMAPNTYLIIWASGKNRTNPAAVLHTDFKLDPDSGYLAFVGPQTNAISDFGLSYPQQRTDVSYGRDPLDPSTTGYYPGTNATPGRINATAGGAADFAPDVLASREDGTFVNSFNLGLSLATPNPNAVIRYVIINTAAQATSSVTNVPTASSPLYTGPIPITQTTQIRARAFEPGKLPGTPVSFSYIQIASSVLNFSSDLPLVILHNFGAGNLPATGDQTAMIATFHSDLDRSSLTNKPDLIGRAGVNDRGSSTQGQTKQNTAVEFWDEFNQDMDRPMLGLPEESDWVLYSINNFDQGLMHNAIFHWFGRTVGYSSRTRFVELFRKTDPGGGPITSSDYFGLYLLEEKPKRNKNRVDIDALQPENTNSATVSGGYLLRIDRIDADERTIAMPATITGPTASIATLPGGTGLIYDYPNGIEMVTDPRRVAQRDYITRYVLNFLTNATGANSRDPATGYANYIDVDSWVENSIINIICYNVDGYRLSGYMYKDRDGKLSQGPPWDCDRCLGTGGTSGGTPSTDSRPFNPRQWRVPTTGIGTDNGTDFFGVSTVAVQWWQPLFRDPDFWQKWIDRYQQYRTNEFTTNAILAMIDGFATEIKEAQVREHTRWPGFTFPRFGVNSANGYSHDFGPRDTRFTQGGFYTNEVNFQKRWFIDRMHFFDTNFLRMPVLGTGDGLVSSGTTVNVQAAPKAGTVIYYTLDGSDPRLPGGAISPQALSSIGNLTLTVTTNIRVFARCYNPNHSNQINTPTIGIGNPLTNSYWSGPVAASYYTSIPPLRITELMYHPADPPAGNTNDQDNFEYIEVRNIGGTPLNVNRFRLRGGVDFDFPNTLIPASGRAVIVRDAAAFAARYGGGITILGSYSNNLANDGDRLILEGGMREPILDFEYDDDWYPITDGPGFSLEIVNDSIATTNWGLKASWRPSGTAGGTPGGVDPGAPSIAAVFVNEALTKTDPIPGDAIELYNSTGVAVDIGGWYLTDDFGTPQKYRIPASVSIPANDYIVFYQSNSFGVGSNGFALSSRGDEVYLFSGNSSSNLTGRVHGFNYGAQVTGATFGRHIISTGEEQFVTRVSATLGAANSSPKIGPVVISEINYHPPDFTYPLGSVDNDVDEYIELQNISDSPVPLYDTANPSNTWRLRDAVNFTFPQGVTVPAGGFILVVNFTPTNGPALDNFRAANGVPPSTPIYGPWDGKLDNSGDNVELVFPDVPDAPGTPSAGFVPYVLADKVDYRDLTPWPQGLADGFGGTLHRNPPSAFGNDPASWQAAVKTPGATIAGGVPPAIVTQPANTVGVGRYSASFTVGATGTAPLAYQWTFNSNSIYGATGPTLTLNNLRLDQAGVYACYVFNGAGFVLSSNAQLSVLTPVTVTGNPLSVKIRGSTNVADYGFTTNNVTFTATVATQRPTQYQWRHNGNIIPNATNVSLTVSNVDFDLHEGDYVLSANDNISADVSQAARLTVLLSPTIIVPPPTNYLVVSNGTISASVVMLGNPAPFYYRWNEQSSPRSVSTTDQRTNYMSYGPITNFAARTWRIIITNEANVAPSAFFQFLVAAALDTDGDGIPDDWEAGYGFGTNNLADAALDSDLDGMSNRAEYIAGTNPTNSASYLRIDGPILGGNGVTLSVGAVSNRTYSVVYSDSLYPPAWSPLAGVQARNTNHVESVTDVGGSTNRYYRVVTPAQ